MDGEFMTKIHRNSRKVVLREDRQQVKETHAKREAEFMMVWSVDLNLGRISTTSQPTGTID